MEQLKEKVLAIGQELLDSYETDITTGLEDGIYEAKDNVESLEFVEEAKQVFEQFRQYNTDVTAIGNSIAEKVQEFYISGNTSKYPYGMELSELVDKIINGEYVGEDDDEPTDNDPELGHKVY